MWWHDGGFINELPELDKDVLSPEIFAIRTLNDRLRVLGEGGEIVLTNGILSLGADTIAKITDAIRTFDVFIPDNDPFGEHDCAKVSVGDHMVIFKIDYFDPSMTFHSDDATNPSITKRVMTIMLASEY